MNSGSEEEHERRPSPVAYKKPVNDDDMQINAANSKKDATRSREKEIEKEKGDKRGLSYTFPFRLWDYDIPIIIISLTNGFFHFQNNIHKYLSVCLSVC